MSHIFISYKSSDKDHADELYHWLEQRHFPVWIDRQNIPLASRWQEEILEAVKDGAKAVVVVWSSDTEQSEWVGIEYNLALDQGIPVIPYILGKPTLPPRLSAQQGIYADESDAKKRLVKRLQEFVFDNSTLQEGQIFNKDKTFRQLAEEKKGVLNILPKLVGIPLGAAQGCLFYLVGREDDDLAPLEHIQLALQFSNKYADDDFVRRIAEHFLVQDPNFKLRILLVRGPLQRREDRGNLIVEHGLPTDETQVKEWPDAVNAIDYITGEYKNKIGLKSMQIFYQGPAVFLYRLGQRNRDMIKTELYHFVRPEMIYVRVFD